jgi:hypothetical protein
MEEVQREMLFHVKLSPQREDKIANNFQFFSKHDLGIEPNVERDRGEEMTKGCTGKTGGSGERKANLKRILCSCCQRSSRR